MRVGYHPLKEGQHVGLFENVPQPLGEAKRVGLFYMFSITLVRCDNFRIEYDNH